MFIRNFFILVKNYIYPLFITFIQLFHIKIIFNKNLNESLLPAIAIQQLHTLCSFNIIMIIIIMKYLLIFILVSYKIMFEFLILQKVIQSVFHHLSS